jgi:hypothetical protein
MCKSSKYLGQESPYILRYILLEENWKIHMYQTLKYLKYESQDILRVYTHEL